MAGVDYLVQDAPVSWLEQPLVRNVTDVAAHLDMQAPAPMQQATPKAKPKLTPAIIPAAIAPANWPNSLDALISEISAGAPLPGNHFGGKSAVPVGIQNAALMIISDLPDVEEIDAGQLGRSAYGRLLTNMVRAMGLDIADCYLTALATTRPASGDLPDDSAAHLVPFIMHQMQLVQPKAALVLGSAACSALFSAELMTARGSLHYFNHNDRNLAAITTFHPRTLLARPILKAQAWNDLQMLMNKDDS